METLEGLDYLALTIYLLIIAGIGVFFGWFVKDIKGYFKGGNAIPWPIGAISNFMGMFSTFVFVAYAGIAYESGIVSVTVLWCTVLPSIVAALFLAKRWRRSGILTPVEYLEKRFNSGVRQLFSWSGIGLRFLDNIVRMYAIGIFIMTATPLSFLQAIVIAGTIITMFTIVGGLWAIVVIDTLQFVIIVFSTLVLIPLSLDAVGGISELMANHPKHFDWFNGPKGQPTWLIAYYIMVILKYNANWVFIQRFYSVKDESASQKLGFFSAGLFFIFPILFMIPAIAAVDILPDLPNPEMAYVATAVKLLPSGLMGLMLAAMFSATMSSLNSEFNVMSGVLTNDIYMRLFKPNESDEHYVWVARINIVLVGISIMIGALFVGELGGAFEANKFLTGVFALPISIPLIFGLLLRKPNPLGAYATVVIGIITGLILNSIPQVSWEIATLSEIIICTLIFYLSGFIKTGDQAYFDRVRDFFVLINTKIKESDKPPVDIKFQQSLAKLFALAMGLTGILFTAMSLHSMHLYSGKLGFFGGITAIFIGIFIFLKSKKII